MPDAEQEELEPEELAAIHSRMAALCLASGQPERARAYLERAVLALPSDLRSLEKLLALSAPEGEGGLLDGIEALVPWLGQNLSNRHALATALVTLGDVVRGVGEEAGAAHARMLYEAALSEDPACARARERLGREELPAPQAPQESAPLAPDATPPAGALEACGAPEPAAKPPGALRPMGLLLAFALGLALLAYYPAKAPWLPGLGATLPEPQRGFRKPPPLADGQGVAMSAASRPVEPMRYVYVAPQATGRPACALAPDAVVEGAGLPPECAHMADPDWRKRRLERLRRRAVLPAVEAWLAADPTEVTPIENPCVGEGSGPTTCRRALDEAFGKFLEVLERERAEPVRVSLWGDSLVAGDAISDSLRLRFGKAFGHGGQGFVHPGVPERMVFSRGLRVFRGGRWDHVSMIRHRPGEALLGLSGVSYTAEPGAFVRVERSVEQGGIARLGLLMVRRSEAGRVRVRTPTGDAFVVLGGAPGEDHVQWFAFDPPIGSVTLSDFDREDIITGVVQENAGPGVVVDNLGLVSSRAQFLQRIEPGHWQEQIERRGTDLMMFFYGANDIYAEVPGQERLRQYRDQYARVLMRAREGSGRNCLVLSVLTGGERRDGRVQTKASVQAVHDAQRATAMQAGCGFWSAFEAIGGPEGARRWSESHPRLLGADLVHPTQAGYEAMAGLFFRAFLASFAQWLREG